MSNTSQISQLHNKPLDYSNHNTFRTVRRFKLPLLLSAAHIPLGILLYNFSILNFLHPAFIFLLGIYYAVRKQEKLERVAYVAAYLVGSEVLWRMAKSSIPWEFGKYGLAMIMIIAIIRRGYWKIPLSALLYLILLIPACFITLIINDLGEARDKLSFNFSGPFALFISCWFFSHLKVNIPQLKKILFMIIIPLISVACVTLFYTLTVEDIQFSNNSNFATSGGFGPNQVSSMLGLGFFVCICAYVLFNNNLKDIIYLSILTFLFAAQSLLTFSRGGMYNALGALLFVILFQMTNPLQNLKRLLPILGLVIILIALIFPYLNDFTGGTLQERFENTDPTSRTEIVDEDYKIF